MELFAPKFNLVCCDSSNEYFGSGETLTTKRQSFILLLLKNIFVLLDFVSEIMNPGDFIFFLIYKRYEPIIPSLPAVVTVVEVVVAAVYTMNESGHCSAAPVRPAAGLHPPPSLCTACCLPAAWLQLQDGPARLGSVCLGLVRLGPQTQ